MPIWGEIQKEISDLAKIDQNPFDKVRRKYLYALNQKRQRATILYATRFTQGFRPGIQPDMTTITDEDLQGFMTVMHGLEEPSLDLILHSPGGSLEAAEGIVKYLRSKFHDDICVIVPQLALSAATMIACSANSIIMGKHSFLGPVDPQFILPMEQGARQVTAQNVEDQFKQAQKDCADPAKMGAWLPMLKQYGPDLLQKCRHASILSESLVAEWLERYMFKNQPNRRKKAKHIAHWLASHKAFGTHGRHLGRDDLRKEGFDTIVDLESDQETQDLVLSVFHASTIAFDGTPAVKIIENHKGIAFIKAAAAPQMMMPPGIMPSNFPGKSPPGFMPPTIAPKTPP
jgi:hypothetical protein